MMDFVQLFAIKMMDNIILTAKSILTYKNKKILSSILIVISQVLFYTVVKQVMSDDSTTTILVVAIASGLGNYFAFPLIDKFKKDEKWHYYLTCSDKEDIEEFCKYLASNKIKYMANLGLTRKGNETINITVFSKTKDESKMIEKYIENTNVKYLKEILR